MSLERNSVITGDVFLQKNADCLSEERATDIQLASHILTAENQFAVISERNIPRVTSEYSHSEVNLRSGKNTRTIPFDSQVRKNSQSIFDLFPPCEGPARVLVADDNLLVRVCLMNLLEQWGMTFHVCANGEDAWIALQESEFDLLLIDLQMPGMNGHEVVARLRSKNNCKNTNIPVVALAGTDSQEDKERMFDVGTNEFLTKPFCPEQLSRILHKYLTTSNYQGARLFVDIIDQQQLNHLYEDDYEHMHFMFGLFIKNTSLSLNSMEKAVNLNDLTSLLREIHKVKPTFAMVGLQKIGQLAGKIESQLQEVSHLSSSIRSDIRRFRKLIKEGVQLVMKQQQSITNYLK